MSLSSEKKKKIIEIYKTEY